MSTATFERTRTLSETTAHCPFQHTNRPQTALDINDELIFLNHKRVIASYSNDASELNLYYGEKEILFDEPELFAFGEALAKHPRFTAGDATRWGDGYEWPIVQPLLEQLIDEGILEHANVHDAASSTGQDGARPSPLPSAPCATPRTWLECAAITRELTGRALDVSYLELVVPVYRVAHVVLDAEGRQVGEANVFPTQLRLEVPTDWRLCPHAGSRYHDDQPMNVTALKSIRQHWPQTMAALLRVREAYFRRFPEARNGWTLGTLQRLSALVLALPAYLTMRTEHRVENGHLHPVLSSMFRITDGVRMAVHSMLFMPHLEPTLPPDTPMTGAELYAFAERVNLFHSNHGVCAGPKAMIEEFLGTLLDGQAKAGIENVALDAPVEAALADLETAFEYGLLGLQAHAVVHSLWPAMARSYEHIHNIVEAWSAEQSDALRGFQACIQHSITRLQTDSLFATETWRVNRENAYADMYAHAVKGLTGKPAQTTLSQCTDPLRIKYPSSAAEQLRSALQQRSAEIVDIEPLVAALINYLRREQTIVRTAGEIQSRINALLDRPSTAQSFTASDINLVYRLQDRERRPPYLVDEVAAVLGLNINVTRDDITVCDHTAAPSGAAP